MTNWIVRVVFCWNQKTGKERHQLMMHYINWMAWCKKDISDFFRWNFFSFKSAWIFSCAFQLSRKTFSCIVFWQKCSCFALLCSLCMLQYFVFVFLRNKVQTRQKKYRGMLYYLIEKHMKKFRHFWRKKNFTWKSHLRPSCTKPFNYCFLILLCTKHFCCFVGA